MYTRNTNSKTNKLESVTISCNAPKCSSKFTGKTNTEVWLQAKKANWLMGHANEHICDKHRGEYHIKDGKAVVRTAKVANVTKSTVAQTKAEKVAKTPNKGTAKVTTTKSGAKVTVGNRVPAKSEGKTAFVGQSTGKLAKSAKKSATK